MGISRREFVKGGALTAATAIAFAGVAVRSRKTDSNGNPAGKESIRALKALGNVKATSSEDSLLVMQRDLVKAMAKPIENRRWGMLIDTRKCVGCYACTIGCIAENKLPPGVVYRPVITRESGVFPDVKLSATPRPCMQCENPSCVPVCPVKATWRRPDGITIIDYDKCIGCRHCLVACPYGARTSDFNLSYNANAAIGAGWGKDSVILGRSSQRDEQKNHEYGKGWSRKNHQSPAGNARKCHFCLHRIEVGQLPVCVTTCIGRATYFGDLNDQNSLIAAQIKHNATYTLLPHRGTEPHVCYIGNKGLENN